MPRADFFSKFNQLLLIKEFLDAGTCAALRHEANMSKFAQAGIIRDGMAMIDVSSRSSLIVKISKEANSLIKEKLSSLKPLLEERFNTELNDFEDPSLLLYKEGDFFREHKDRSDLGDSSRRQVSIVIFLNGESSGRAEGTYEGGGLCLFGLVDDPRWKNYGFPLSGEEGLLIAFPSTTLHAVKPVTVGRRYTIVSWFSGPN